MTTEKAISGLRQAVAALTVVVVVAIVLLATMIHRNNDDQVTLLSRTWACIQNTAYTRTEFIQCLIDLKESGEVRYNVPK